MVVCGCWSEVVGGAGEVVGAVVLSVLFTVMALLSGFGLLQPVLTNNAALKAKAASDRNKVLRLTNFIFVLSPFDTIKLALCGC